MRNGGDVHAFFVKACNAAIVLTVVLISFNARAGAWTQPQGQGQVITGFNYYRSDAYFDNGGRRQKTSD